ncbi:MAG: ATP phosphoribosyltransferase [Spirochaetes bacterium]|jgi:ATP phosphoribosyltransferase|nr:ATP phosphoribosyltransferase [Spirochaetota bacterium]
MSAQATEPLTLALPKGRLLDQTREFFEAAGLRFDVESRRLVAQDREGLLTIMFVKNSDVPTYLHHGIAGLAICGEDVVYESGHAFYRLLEMPYGSTRICLASKADFDPAQEATGRMRVATKFTRFTRDFFHRRGLPVEVIRLNGSVELAPILGLAPYIVDLVETGSTLKANNLIVREELAQIKVHLLANPAYYKYYFRQIDRLIARLRATEPPGGQS